jgi:mono/diheme cytochrome c family protein
MSRVSRHCFCILLSLVLGAANALAADRNRSNFLLHCSGCHQQDGSGSPENGIPSMKGRVSNFLRLPEGRAFLVQVPGTSQSALGDAAVAELLNWMVNNFSRDEIPPEFIPYTAIEVARLRALRPSDVPAKRAAIVGSLRDMGYRVE